MKEGGFVAQGFEAPEIKKPKKGKKEGGAKHLNREGRPMHGPDCPECKKLGVTGAVPFPPGASRGLPPLRNSRGNLI